MYIQLSFDVEFKITGQSPNMEAGSKWTSNKGWSSSLGIGWEANNSNMLQNVTQEFGS